MFYQKQKPSRKTLQLLQICCSGRFLQWEQCERWRDDQKLVSWSKHRGCYVGFGDKTPRKMLSLYMQNPAIWCICGRKMVRNAIHNACTANSWAFLNTFNSGNSVPVRSGSFSTMKTASPRVLLRNDPDLWAAHTSGAVLAAFGDGGWGAVEYMYWNRVSIWFRETPPPWSDSCQSTRVYTQTTCMQLQ